MKKLVEDILTDVRNRIASEETVDDIKAKEIILQEIFKRPVLAQEDMHTLISKYENIFYKTRSRLGILKPLVDDPDITEQKQLQ